MDSGLATSLSGALAQSKRVDKIANNLANADTVAFKQDGLIFQETLEAAHRQDTRSDVASEFPKESEVYSNKGAEVRPVLYGAEFTDLKAGSLRHTGNSMDLAIEGNGFFEVATPDGIRLTRAGNLTMDGVGRLVTSDGFLVLGPGRAEANPETRAIRLPDRQIAVDADGTIYSSNERGRQVLGRLSLVQVSNPTELKKSGGNLFEPSLNAGLVAFGAVAGQGNRAPATLDASARRNPLGIVGKAPKVHQGFLEGSNVNPILEMTSLIEAHRMFDQNTKLMNTFSDLSSRVSEIGKF